MSGVGAYTVAELDARDARWDAFVSSCGSGRIYHHSSWIGALEEEYGRAAIRLACLDGAGSVVGVLPLMQTRGLPFHREGAVAGRRLSSLPRTPVAGPVSTDAGSAQSLVRAAIERAEATGNTRLELKVESPWLDECGVGLQGRRWRDAYVVDLPRTSEVLRFGDARNHSAIKRAVAKANAAGVEVRDAASEGELRSWYRLHLQTMRSNIVPARSYRFFAALWKHLHPGGRLRLLLAAIETGGRRRLLAGLILLSFGDRVSYAFGGSDSASHHLRPNDALHWHAIHEACEQGYRHYDLGEVDAANTGLAAYKRKWAPVPTALYRYYHPAPPPLESFANGGVGSSRLKSLWRRTPLTVTAHVGDAFYRFL